jgi:hypothetical protein
MTTENTLEFSNVIFTMSTQYILDILVASLLVHRYDVVLKTSNKLKGARYEWMNDS